MYGGKYPVNYPTLGAGFGDTSYQNNMFDMTWGPDALPNQQKQTSSNYATVVFEADGWTCDVFSINGERHFKDGAVLDRAILKELVEAVLAHPELKEKLQKWHKDVIKRLQVSVPRLKQEYEASAARLKALDGTDFSF